MFPSAAPAVPAGDPTAVPASPAGAVPGALPPLTPAQTSAWWKRIEAALQGTKGAIDTGKINTSRYKAEYFDRSSSVDRIAVPTDFYYVEQKKSLLFYRLPEVFLKPELPGLEDAAVVFQAALNKKIGPSGVNILPRVQQVLFDLMMVGFGAVKVGYQTVVDGTKPMPMGVGPDGVTPITADAPNIVAEWYFAEHVSPGDLLVPPDFVGLDFDDSPFIGVRFKEDADDDEGVGGSDKEDDDRRLTPLSDAARVGKRKQKTGFEVWYRACRFDKDVKHPDKIRCFKIYDDDRETVVGRKDSPYQKTTPAGKLIEGMRGYPIVPLTTRFVSDSWLPPADGTIARAQADELSKCRTQQIEFKNRSMPQWGFDSTVVTPDIQGKIERNESGAGIPFNAGAGEQSTWPIKKGDFPRISFEFQNYIQDDLGKIWGISTNGLGQLDEKSRTATEQQIASSASQGRMESERESVLHWYVHRVIPKFGSLLQMFADEQEFVELIGSDAQRLKAIPPDVQQQAQQAGQDARVLVPWNKDAIKGLFSFSAKPNSQLHIDAAQFRKELMDLYNFFANEPTVNRGEMVREILQAYGFDPSKLIQQPPAKTPEPPKPALSFSATADLNPFSPQYPNVVAVLTPLGVTGLVPPAVDPATANALQTLSQGPASETQHGGAAMLAEKVNQHQADTTGGMQGSGAPAPIAPGGHL